MTYQRNLTVRLFLLRLLFVSGAASCVYLFNAHLSDYGYILSVLLIFSSLMSLAQLKIQNGNIGLVKYYFFGMIPIKRAFHKNDIISISPFEVELQTDS